MKWELGIARCGLACCLCSENINCQGCNSGQCPDREWCENRKCSIEKTKHIVIVVVKSVEKVCYQK